MVDEDRALLGDPRALARANRRFHSQIHRASHNAFLMAQLDLVYRSMALLATTSLAVEGRGETALAEHGRIVEAIASGDGEAAAAAVQGAYLQGLRDPAAGRCAADGRASANCQRPTAPGTRLSGGPRPRSGRGVRRGGSCPSRTAPAPVRPRAFQAAKVSSQLVEMQQRQVAAECRDGGSAAARHSRRPGWPPRRPGTAPRAPSIPAGP